MIGFRAGGAGFRAAGSGIGAIVGNVAVSGNITAVGITASGNIACVNLAASGNETVGGTAVVTGQGTYTAQQRNVPVALTDGANIAVNAASGNIFTVTLAGNRTLDFPSGVVAGMAFIIVVTQDGTGSRTLAYGAGYSFGDEGVPVLSTTASRVDVISCVAWSATKIACTILKNFT